MDRVQTLVHSDRKLIAQLMAEQLDMNKEIVDFGTLFENTKYDALWICGFLTKYSIKK